MQGTVKTPQEYMIYFMFHESMVQFSLIFEGEFLPDTAIESQFFPEPPVGGIFEGFPGIRVAATGIGPKTSRMIFLFRPFLKKHFTAAIQDEYGKGPVQNPQLVGFGFFNGA